MANTQRLSKFLDTASLVLMAITILVTPLFVDSRLVNFYLLPKEYLFGGLVLLTLVVWIIKIILLKTVRFRHSVLDLPVLLLLVAGFFSAIFSVDRYGSFVGRGDFFTFHFVWLLFVILFYLLVVQQITTRKRWLAMLDMVVAAGAVSAVWFLLKRLAHISFLIPRFSTAGNTVDSLNSVWGVWLVIIFTIAAGFLIKKRTSVARSICYGVAAALCFANLLLLSFNMMWWLALISIVLLLVLGVSFLDESRIWWLCVLFASFIAIVVFIFFGAPRMWQISVPSEVSLGPSPSWTVANHAVFSGVKNFLFGSGLGTFGYDFSKFRNASFNADPVVWSLRFNQPFSSIFSILGEGGVSFALVFVFLALLLVGHTLSSWFERRREIRTLSELPDFLLESTSLSIEVFLVAIAWVVATIGMAMFFYSIMLWWLWWVLFGLSVSGLFLVNTDLKKIKEFRIKETPEYHLSFSFAMIILLTAVVMFGVWGSRVYLGDVAYAKALSSNDYGQAEASLARAISLDSHNASYYLALAELYLNHAVKMSQDPNADKTAVTTLVAQSVNNMRTAVDLSPNAVVMWENSATVYENAAALVPDARDWAVKSLLAAQNLEPTNPLLAWRLGNDYVLQGKKDDAITSYQQAVALKKDYAGAYAALASLYEQGGDLDKAVSMYQQVLAQGANDAEFLYAYGRLLFNRNSIGDRTDAEQIWQRVLRLSPNHSNTLYSLGLLYEWQSKKDLALEYYRKVQVLNPNNKDLAKKINSLTGAAPAVTVARTRVRSR